MKIKAVIFDAFGTLFKVTDGGSARTIRNHIITAGVSVDEATFREEWKDYYKKHTSDECEFMTEREIFISRILKDNGLSAEEVLFVGDSITDDILGPRAVGMKTVWVDRKGISGDVGQDGTVVTLSGLWEVIR